MGRSSELTKDQVGQKVIGDPEDGCRSLLVRLSADLERAGTILPQQLKIVLSGLGTLSDRAKAARLHGVSEERVRAALLTLVDPITGQKTREMRRKKNFCVIERNLLRPSSDCWAM